MHVEGNNLNPLEQEAGGHRIQRIPPTEKRGRVHSSTVTVAVLDEVCDNVSAFLLRDPEHFQVEWFSGTGSGGQHRNKHQNSARITHLPTGIVKIAQTRSRQNSLSEAMAAIHVELDRIIEANTGVVVNNTRRGQVGTGERSDKVRTLRFQADEVIDHRSGRRMNTRSFMKGQMDELWTD